MRIAVIGAGVLGSLYAGRLTLAGHEVTLIARGRRFGELQSGPLVLSNEVDGRSIEVVVPAARALASEDCYELVLVMVRANQVEGLLPELAANSGVPCFVFMHNRASGSSKLAEAVGAQRVLLGFPGAGGERDGNTIRYRLIAEQATTLGAPDGRRSPRLTLLASVLERAGFRVALSRHMDDWLKAHALFVTAIAGAIYEAGGHAREVALNRVLIRRLVIGIREGFAALSATGVAIEPKNLAFLFSLPHWAPELYWRRYLSLPHAELIFARHARAAPDEMCELVEELRTTYPGAFDRCLELKSLWDEVETASTK